MKAGRVSALSMVEALPPGGAVVARSIATGGDQLRRGSAATLGSSASADKCRQRVSAGYRLPKRVDSRPRGAASTH